MFLQTVSQIERGSANADPLISRQANLLSAQYQRISALNRYLSDVYLASVHVQRLAGHKIAVG